MSDTLAYRRVFGVLVPYFNTVVQPELDDLRPPGVSNQVARFTLDANVLQNVVETATKLMTCGPEAIIVGLSTESFPDGLSLLQQGVDDLRDVYLCRPALSRTSLVAVSAFGFGAGIGAVGQRAGRTCSAGVGNHHHSSACEAT